MGGFINFDDLELAAMEQKDNFYTEKATWDRKKLIAGFWQSYYYNCTGLQK